MKIKKSRFLEYNRLHSLQRGLERVEVFKYLGRLMAMENTQAIRGNLCKVRKVWNTLHRLLRGENTTPMVCSMLFKAVVQAVLLYGSETC